MRPKIVLGPVLSRLHLNSWEICCRQIELSLSEIYFRTFLQKGNLDKLPDLGTYGHLNTQTNKFTDKQLEGQS